MGHFASLSTAIKNVLTPIQQGGAAAFVDVQTIPTLQFKGYPAVTVVPADNLSDYANVVQNLRTYVFDIDIYYDIPQQAGIGGYDKAFSVMLILVDSVLDAIDNSNDLNNTADFVRPAPSVWSIVQTSAGSALNARITVMCAVTVTQNNG